VVVEHLAIKILVIGGTGGSLAVIGDFKEIREMLGFGPSHQIESYIELIPIQWVNEVHERVVRGDVWFRFVIDLASTK
jgi:D-arabinose 1-dehydrogenase-like Zn-dependent alcohol dehydrogenase